MSGWHTGILPLDVPDSLSEQEKWLVESSSQHRSTGHLVSSHILKLLPHISVYITVYSYGTQLVHNLQHYKIPHSYVLYVVTNITTACAHNIIHAIPVMMYGFQRTRGMSTLPCWRASLAAASTSLIICTDGCMYNWSSYIPRPSISTSAVTLWNDAIETASKYYSLNFL